MLGGDGLFVAADHQPNGIQAGALDLCGAVAVHCSSGLGHIDPVPYAAELDPEQGGPDHLVRQVEPDDVVEASPHCGVEKRGMVGRGDEQRVGVVLVDDLQHGRYNAAQLTMIRTVRPLPAQQVELLKEQDPRSGLQEPEDLLQVPGRLTKVGGDDDRQLDARDGKPELAGDGERAHRLARPGRSHEQQARAGLHAVGPKLGAEPELLDDRLQCFGDRGGQHEVLEGHAGLHDAEERMLVAGLR